MTAPALFNKDDRVKLDARVIEDQGDEIVVEVEIPSLRGFVRLFALRKNLELAS